MSTLTTARSILGLASRIAKGSRVASVRVLPSRVVSVAAEVESGTSSGLARD